MSREIIVWNLKNQDVIKFGDYRGEFVKDYMKSAIEFFGIEPTEYGLEGWKNQAKMEYVKLLLQLKEEGCYIQW